MHNAEKPNPPASVRDTGGQGGLSASSKTRARNSLRAVAPQSAPSGEVHGEGIEQYAFSNALPMNSSRGSTRVKRKPPPNPRHRSWMPEELFLQRCA